jgi:hypothetical protein
MANEMVIHIPQQLADRIAASGLRIEMRDSLALMACLIASRSTGASFRQNSYDLIAKFVRRPKILMLKQQLFDWRIIECDGKYSTRTKKPKSLGYRITESAAESPVIQYQVSSASCLNRLSKQSRECRESSRPRARIEGGDVHQWLWDCLRRTHMDEWDARIIADNLEPNRRWHAHVSIDWFVQRRLWFKQDRFGRVHTNITSLKKQLRPTLHFGNYERLVELDIRCSQPTLVYAMLPMTARSADDALEYLKLCRSGELYPALAGEIPRGKAKGAYFHYLYSWQESKHVRCTRTHQDEAKELARRLRYSIADAMAKQFPTVDEFILRTKRRLGHKGFSHEMQRLESRLLIDGVCGRTMRENPSTTLLTIHDSLLTDERSLQSVHSTFSQTLDEFGIDATITTTNY